MSHLFKLKPMIKLYTLAAVTLLLPSIALAGGTATVIATSQPMQTEGQTTGEESTTMTITWANVNTMRMDLDDPSHYLIMRDGKAYSVSQDDGEMQVMDMSSMSAMIQTMGNKGEKNDNPFGSIDSVKATGASKTIAGIKGQVYHMKWTDPDGSHQSGDAVLTNDPLVVEMTEAYLSSMGAIVGAEHTRNFQDALPNGERGLLQMGDQFYVESIQRADPPASTFKLPAEPIDLQNLLGSIGQSFK